MTENVIKILGHRGARRHDRLYENTLDAFSHALDVADGIETDVVLSADGVPYLLHDRTMKFVPYIASKSFSAWQGMLNPLSRDDVAGREFHQMYSSEIDRLLLTYGDHIPRLSELFELVAAHAAEDAEYETLLEQYGQSEDDQETYSKKIINLELKAPGSAWPVLDEIFKAERKGLIDYSQIIISSFDHDEIANVQKIDSCIKTALVFWQDSFRPCRLYPYRTEDAYRDRMARSINLETIANDQTRRVRPDYFTVPAKGLKKIYSDAMAEQYPGSRFILWTPGFEPNPALNRTLHKKICDPDIGPEIEAIITDHPADRTWDILRHE